MNTKMQLDAMKRSLPYVAELLDCEAIKECKRKLKNNEYQSSGDVFSDIVPIFLSEKRDAFLGLIGSLSGKTIEQMEALEWEQTKKLMDEAVFSDLFDFFSFSAHMVSRL